MTEYLFNLGIRVRYMHHEIETMDRIATLRDLRAGEFDVLVGINLLREGLDLPEVSLIAILDADKEGFLRNETSLIQIIGRAARNAHGEVIMYADTVTPSMERAIRETERRRNIQMQYNQEHHIVPKTIVKPIQDISAFVQTEEKIRQIDDGEISAQTLSAKALEDLIQKLTAEMKKASDQLDFEYAAQIRDKIRQLQTQKKEKK